MQPLSIDLQGLPPDLPQQPDGNSVLTAAVAKAIDPTRPIPVGAGFDNRV